MITKDLSKTLSFSDKSHSLVVMKTIVIFQFYRSPYQMLLRHWDACKLNTILDSTYDLSVYWTIALSTRYNKYSRTQLYGRAHKARLIMLWEYVTWNPKIVHCPHQPVPILDRVKQEEKTVCNKLVSKEQSSMVNTQNVLVSDTKGMTWPVNCVPRKEPHQQ